jgi:hypothetical protein
MFFIADGKLDCEARRDSVSQSAFAKLMDTEISESVERLTYDDTSQLVRDDEEASSKMKVRADEQSVIRRMPANRRNLRSESDARAARPLAF